MPLTQPWFLGIANIRGNLYSVIDFGAFLGREASLSGSAGQGRLVAVRAARGRAQGRHRRAARAGLAQPRGARAGVAAGRRAGWYGQRWMDADGGAWQEIDLARLAQDPGFLRVGTLAY